jgi:drug/metabolite transporter (DMT)-like permease
MSGDKSNSGRGGLGLALISAASFSTSGSLARSLTDAGWSPAAAVAVRCAVAAALLVVPAIIELRGRWRALRRGARVVIAYGVITVAGCQVCYFNAVQHLPVGLALLVEYLGIVLVILWAWMRGQRPRRLMVAGSIAALIGLALVIDPTGDRDVDMIGVLWALGAAIGLAAYFILSEGTDDALPPTTLAYGGMVVATVAVLACGAIGVVPFRTGSHVVELAGHHVGLWIAALALGLVATAVPYVVGIHAVRRLGPRLSSFVALTEVVFAVLVAWLLLGQLPTAAQVIGGAVIFAGIAVIRLDELAHAPPRSSSPP